MNAVSTILRRYSHFKNSDLLLGCGGGALSTVWMSLTRYPKQKEYNYVCFIVMHFRFSSLTLLTSAASLSNAAVLQRVDRYFVHCKTGKYTSRAALLNGKHQLCPQSCLIISLVFLRSTQKDANHPIRALPFVYNTLVTIQSTTQSCDSTL